MKIKKIISSILIIATLISTFCVGSFSVSAASSFTSKNTEPSSSDYVYWNGSKMIKSSSMTSSKIAYIQEFLNWCITTGKISNDNLKKYSASRLTVDKSFGPACQKLTKAYQKQYSLDPDGKFGPESIKKMKSVISAAKSTPNVKQENPRTTTNNTQNNTTTKQTASNSSWLWPADVKRITTCFADNVYHQSHWHRGIDIPLSVGANVYATRSGKVANIATKCDPERGWWIIVDHGDGYYSLYQHLSKICVKNGDNVIQGKIIAKSGNSGSGGNHLHFEVWNLGKSGKNVVPNTPWNYNSQYVNTDPSNSDKVFITKSNDKNSGNKIGQKQNDGVTKAKLIKSSKSAGSGVVYCSDQYGLSYIFK